MHRPISPALAHQRLAPIEHSMRLEGQAGGAKDFEAQLGEFVRTMNPSRFVGRPVSETFAEPDEAATPRTREETRDLIPAHIARAQEWAMDGRRRDLLSERFIRDLHRRTYGGGPGEPA